MPHWLSGLSCFLSCLAARPWRNAKNTNPAIAKSAPAVEQVLKILTDPSGTRRVLIVRRPNGLFGYEEEELQNKYDDELRKRLNDALTVWVRFTQRPFTICDSPETAEREARGNVKWLSLLAG